ncbi:MAG TPA: hypothetical protein VJH04_04155 [archaeon]|nr:hypothetical protein [archaeon]
MIDETKSTDGIRQGNVERVRYAFQMVQEKYSFFSRNMSESDQRNLRRYVHYLIRQEGVEAIDLAFDIMLYQSKFSNSGLPVS